MPTVNPLRDRRARPRAVFIALLLVAALAGAVVAAAERSPWGTALAVAVGAAVELVLYRRWPTLAPVAKRAGAGSPTLAAIRLVAVVLLAARCLGGSVVVGAASTAVIVPALLVAADALRLVTAQARALPLVSRGLDLGGVTMPRGAAQAFLAPLGLDAIVALPAALGLWRSVRDGHDTGAWIGLAVSVALAAAPSVVLGVHLVVLRRAGLRRRMTDAIGEAIEQLAPEVILYFAATAAELYQLRMWLDPVARLGRPALVVVRDRRVVDELGPSELPVICTPYNGVMASLPLPDKVVAMFVTHSGNNLAMLRRPEARSVFVGHGDSDKPDSANPFARVYDQVWVAGPLGRRRYRTAGVGIAAASIVEVGRPQAALASVGVPRTTTIVYAPTWEGWGDDPHHSSLVHIGPALVARLAARPDLTVRFRPHPLTGNRDPALRAAQREVMELVGRVPENEPIAETFAQASAVIGDVSSVINEFLPYDRPYAVVDTRALGSAELVARYPSVAGGVIVGADLSGLDELIEAAFGGPDSTASARRALLADVLGDPATAQQRFADAVDALLR